MAVARTFQMLEVAAAQAIIEANMPVYAAESCTISAAHGRILRENVSADRDQPPFDRVTMDGIGFAFSSFAAGTRTFHIQGIQRAGIEAQSLLSPQNCFEVMTGAVMPVGCDTVLRIEDVEVAGDTAKISEGIEISPRQSIHTMGSDHKRGTTVVRSGQRLSAPQLAVAASCGKATLSVSHTPSVAVISTGDELVDVHEPVLPYQIRRSNSYAIRGALLARGFQRVELFHLQDDPDHIRHEIARILSTFEVVMLAGGVSMGKFDHIPDVLNELGVECLLHGVKQRPGKPMWFGLSRDRQPVFALPGNPVSAVVCMHRYALPALEKAMALENNSPEYAVLLREQIFKPKLTYFLPVKLEPGLDGVLGAKPNPTNGSGDYGALVDTDGFVELDEQRDIFPEGHVARLWRWA
jgi:molybdopterin molybdotransferase